MLKYWFRPLFDHAQSSRANRDVYCGTAPAVTASGPAPASRRARAATTALVREILRCRLMCRLLFRDGALMRPSQWRSCGGSLKVP
jgi:hypothetical protein